MRLLVLIGTMAAVLVGVSYGDIVVGVASPQDMSEYLDVLSSAWPTLHSKLDAQLEAAHSEVPAEYSYLMELLGVTDVPSEYDASWASQFVQNAQSIGPTTIVAEEIPGAEDDPGMQPTQVETTNSDGVSGVLDDVTMVRPTIVVAINGNANRQALDANDDSSDDNDGKDNGEDDTEDGSSTTSDGTSIQTRIQSILPSELYQNMVTRAVAGLASLLAGLYWLRSLASLASLYVNDDGDALCGGTHWRWSLESDCIRTNFLWPAVLLGVGAAAAILFAQQLLLRRGCGSPTDYGKNTLRRLPGAVVVVDNRLWVGAAVAILAVFQTGLFGTWWSNAKHRQIALPQMQAQVSGFVAVAAVASIVTLAGSGSKRLDQAGLFPLALPILVATQLAVGASEMYYSFLTPQKSSEAMWGRHATFRANILTATTLLSFAHMLAHGLVQRRALFMRAEADSAAAQAVSGDEANGDEEVTPLARRTDQRPSQLADTPEHSTSWLSKLAFAWAGPLLSIGARRQLEVSDMYNLAEADTPVPNWRRYLRHRRAGRSLFMAIVRTFAFEISAQAAMAAFSTLLKYAAPFFLQRIIRTIESNGSSEDTAGGGLRNAYVCAIAMLICTICESSIDSQTLWIGRKIGIRLKGMMVAELSVKTLRRRGKGGWEDDDDDDKDDDDAKDGEEEDGHTAQAAADGKIMNLLTADFQRVSEVASYLHEMHMLPLQLAIGVWYIYTLLGVSALVGLSICVVYLPLSKMLFQRLTKIENKLNAISDERVTEITELLQGIKAIKLFGWESRFTEKIDERRERQLAQQWRLVYEWVKIAIASTLLPMLVLVLSFAAYTMVFGHTLTAEIAFTSVSVFQILRTTLEYLPGHLTWGVSGYVSLNRIGSYLSQPEVQSLESRVQPTEGTEVLGFANADLEWESAEPEDKSAATEELSASSESEVPATEQTPLLGSGNGSSDTLGSVDGKAPFALRDIDVQFPAGGLSVVAGATGSGKSSLLAGLIGEMNLTRGRVLLPTGDARKLGGRGAQYSDMVELTGGGLAIRDIAYVAQEAWLRNATIRENILFGERYDQQRYEEVLRVCALKADLRILRAGDQTEIGERGVTLSGGQKQRVALARAVYSSRRILLIDDCLSAVDAHTAKHILTECLLGQTPLMQGRTRVLVTHHVKMCLPFAQFMVMLREGVVAMKGAPQELQQLGVFSKALADIESAGAKKEEEEPEAEAADSDAQDEKAAEDVSEDEHNVQRLRKIAEQRGLDPHGDLSALEGTLVEDEERESGYVKFSVWLEYLSACGGYSFWIGMLVFLMVEQLALVMQYYWVRIWVSSLESSGSDPTASLSLSMVGAGPSFHAGTTVPSLGIATAPQATVAGGTAQHSTAYWLGMYLLIGLAGTAWDVCKIVFMFTGSVRASRSLHARLLRSVVRATPRFFDSTPLGRMINRFSRDMEAIDEMALDLISWCISDLMAVLSVIAVISATAPAFMVVAGVVTVAYVLVAHYYLTSSRELKRIESNSMSPLLSLFGELILGVSTIRAFGATHYYVKEALDRITAHNRPFNMVWACNRWLSMRIEAIGAVVSFSCALLILSNIHRVDAALAGFVMSYALTFSWRMLWLVRNYSTSELNMNAVERVSQYLGVEQEAPLHVSAAASPPASWPATGAVRIEDLVIEYAPGVPVLHGLSLEVAHGEKIGVVGRTGAGKSTLSLALLRFIEAAQGRVLLDGRDIASVGLEDLRRRVTIIPQDPVLFNGSIRFNLDPLGEYSDELMWDALRRAHLVRENQTEPSDGDAAQEPGVERMAGVFTSLDAEIREGGQNLSLGQRQLVALARALVRRSRLIVMDEATASVDFDTDDRIQRTIRGPEFADSTLFCIAHRLRTVIDYDRILVLDKGKVAEFDTPHALMQLPGGIFRSMCERSGEYASLSAAAALASKQKSL
ncbi:hypothetical protein H4R20_000852 [Coemansia guatemalensis]|uniref:P-loop containing nucleoside triphosphate hydrolase protein n=1 Tax=Coemansia guatemalensis TaxID=2761395 RepID=A0A9W8I0P2_9FUNG|nr:hypothetical protein H4R20_000852 [Coemansia guatemalensis]